MHRVHAQSISITALLLVSFYAYSIMSSFYVNGGYYVNVNTWLVR